MSVQLIDLIVLSQKREVLLLSHRGRWALPSAICGQGAPTWRLALALLGQLVGSCPGQRVWLLGFWPPVAAYLALLPASAALGPVVGGRWWPAGEALALVTSDQERWLIRRALAWLAEGGEHRKGIVGIA